MIDNLDDTRPWSFEDYKKHGQELIGNKPLLTNDERLTVVAKQFAQIEGLQQIVREKQEEIDGLKVKIAQMEKQAARIEKLEAENKIEAGKLIEGYWRGRRLVKRFYDGVTDDYTMMWQDNHYTTEELALLKDTEEYLEFLKEGGE